MNLGIVGTGTIGAGWGGCGRKRGNAVFEDRAILRRRRDWAKASADVRGSNGRRIPKPSLMWSAKGAT